jgi:anhydro-N-acetylmuramic acid kinase
MKNNFKVIGMMSGTSLDGLDIAFCEFRKEKRTWDFEIRKSQVIRYPRTWLKRLSQAHLLNPEELMSLDSDFGKFLGQACRKFVTDNALDPQFICSHGHTVLHQPKRGFTLQIGNGNAIHAQTGLPVVYDFRSLDVMLGGEGAPLVPAGDRFLFSEQDICLNLGGIANLSATVGSERQAFDICFCNMSLNYLMGKKGKEYDRGGSLSSTGKVNEKLLGQLSRVYKPLRKKRPSLGREMFEKWVQPILDDKSISLQDKLATCTESTAIEIVEAAIGMKGRSMLCTGGGAFNSYLISRILDHSSDRISIIVPDEQIIKFKEALVFAFLGVLRVRGEVNCLSSVTGASKDSSGGVTIGF